MITVRRYLSLLSLLLMAFGPARAGVLDLDRVPESLDHGLELGASLGFEKVEWAGKAFDTADLDGDGDLDLAILISRGFMVFAQEGSELRILWQENLPPEQLRVGANLRLSTCPDIDDDGSDEVLYIYRRNDAGDHALCLINRGDGPRWRELPLPAGEDSNDDGRWDGWYYFIGAVPGALPDGGPGLLLGCVVGYDRYHRGLRLIDPADGKEVWRFEMGPNPTAGAAWIGDLDEDGEVEIITAANAPHNLGDEKVNGSSDDRAWVFVLEADGRLRWARPQGIHFFTLDLALGDLTGDGLPELVTSTRHHSAGASGDTLMVMDPRDGQILALEASDNAVNGLVVGENRIHRRGEILCTNTIGEFIAYDLREGRLERRLLARAEGPLRLLGRGEILHEYLGQETALATAAGRLLILDDRHRPRACAVSPYQTTTGRLPFDIWEASTEMSYLIGNAQVGRFGLIPVHLPRPLPAKLPMIVLTILTLILSVVVGLAFKRPRNVKSHDPDRRESLLRILGELEDARHGRFPATEALDRLLKMIRLAEEGEAPRARALPLLRTSLEAFREAGLPRLRGILEMTVACRLSAERARETRITLEATMDSMEHLVTTDLDADILDAELEFLAQSCSRVEQDLLSIRDAARRQFSTEPRSMLGRLLVLQEEIFAERNIALEFEEGGAGGACHIDSADLQFILDNLLDNAIRSMKERSGGRLRIDMESIGSKLRIDVKDDGIGIPTARRGLVFEPGFTTKGESEEGGLGLSRSRELLRRWGGKLELMESSEGQGSRFRLTLPLVERSAVTRPKRRAAARGAGAT